MLNKKKNTLEFKLNNPDLDENLMHEIIEYTGKNNNTWYKNIKPFLFEGKNLLEFHYKLAKDYFATRNKELLDHYHNTTTNHSVRHCPAIGNAFLNKVFKIKVPHDILIDIGPEGDFIWKAPNGLVSLEWHHPSQYSSPDSKIFQNHVNIKFVFDAVVQSSQPYMYLQPQFEEHNELLKVVTGVVEGGYIKSQPLIINTLVKIQKETTQIYLKKGDVLAYMWFPEKMNLKYNSKIRDFLHVKFYGGIEKLFFQKPKK